ncbi:uncharacterized protein LOC119444411 [Dermacentor silvarum]|uniref:uncharacterized protein LOC119444411 n=1 Tax=Dermacentor silvarum TaxID=543639 RepID=UPI002101D402|nr:uncharacterized protein LOC119444411 [Dermacentor silvarum]
MRGISILAALVVFATHAYGGPLNRLFCPPLCNPRPETPLRSCVHSCGFLRYGKYYDGSRCWYFGRSGKFLRIKGYCKQGLCLRVLTTGYEGSDAQTYCGVDQTKVVLHKATEGKGSLLSVTQTNGHTSTEKTNAVTAEDPHLSEFKSTNTTRLEATVLAHTDNSTKGTNYGNGSLEDSTVGSTNVAVTKLGRSGIHGTHIEESTAAETTVLNKTASGLPHREIKTVQPSHPQEKRAKQGSTYINKHTNTQPALTSSAHDQNTTTTGLRPPPFPFERSSDNAKTDKLLLNFKDETPVSSTALTPVEKAQEGMLETKMSTNASGYPVPTPAHSPEDTKTGVPSSVLGVTPPTELIHTAGTNPHESTKESAVPTAMTTLVTTPDTLTETATLLNPPDVAHADNVTETLNRTDTHITNLLGS